MKLHEMKQKRNTIASDMRALHEKIGDTTWTEEQRTQWSAAKSELDALDVRIAREDELRRQDQNYVDDNEKENRHQQNKDPANPDAKADERRAAAFDRLLRHGFNELSAEERQAVKEIRAQGTSPDDKGGYTVPTQMRNTIIEAMKAYGGIASIAQILNTSTGQDITWSTSDGTTEEGELLAENTAATEGDVTFGTATLGAKKLSSKTIRVSNELLQDSGVDIEAYLASRIAQRIGRGEAKYLVQGTGVGTPIQPKGLVASVTGTVSTGNAASFQWQEMNSLKHALDPAYRGGPNFRWAFNDTTLQYIEEMVDDQKRPLWLPDVIGGTPATVLGIPYVIDQAIDSIAASKKFIFLGDFNRFIVRRVAYMTLKRLVERYAEYDQTAFLAFHRFDCVLEDTAAIKALVGKAP
ncbi:TPA: phage major capsid protein [Citrobacter freundii]|jgi:HK97 family phage major capsid protein|uniref:Phage major capsid protein n=1 Tax=Citrobacter gillenii TaxID=67828 RepID=A0ABD6LXH4_9ENTR|nr:MULTISPECIES: phage major capsid protein [Citrobacter]HCL5682429.1 phage major capsid protein [Citrobacter freundii]MBD0829374.1 phage major capsid protein [Citrobacter sp. C1]NTZ49067.1 phage major capsid protein [Citrobacter gillenii]RFU88906.1 phage major capsid protein [Citrobacter gillenii]HCL6564262.1 phage major capsid protein [Citrobacter freundii]